MTAAVQGWLQEMSAQPKDEKETKERKNGNGNVIGFIKAGLSSFEKNGNGSNGTLPECYRSITCDLSMLDTKQVIF